MHKGLAGVANLNMELQKELIHKGMKLSGEAKTLRTGDKVMQIRNNYDKDVYNGDIGTVMKIDRELQEMKIDYDGRVCYVRICGP